MGSKTTKTESVRKAINEVLDKEPVKETKDPEEETIVLNDAETKEATLDFETFFSDKFFETDFTIKLYRKVGEGVKRRSSFLREYHNETPSEVEIGNEFGSGEFILMGVHPKLKKLFSKTLWIDEIYDAMKVKPEPAAIPQAQQQNSLADGVELVGKVMTIITPLLNQTPQNTGADPMNMMKGITGIFTDGLKQMQGAMIRNSIDNMKLVTKPEQSEEADGLRKGILDVIKQFGDHFLGASGKKEELMKSMINEDERFQALKENEDLLNEVYSECCDNPEIGKSKIDGVMEKLGVNIPDEKPAENPDG